MPTKRLSTLAVSLFASLAFLAAGSFASAQSTDDTKISEKEAIDAISENFSSIPTMAGEFVQFGPNGEQTGGVFYIERPGKIRFNYENPASIEVISNGRTVAVHNKKLKTWDFYPLNKTPLKMLLDEEIEVDSDKIQEVNAESDLTTVVMGDDSVFGDAIITLMFDPEEHDLRQWTIKDAKGAETSVMIFNVQKNVEIPERLFEFDEREIRRRMRENETNR